MRKFIVSDLHGDGNVYDSIMMYLDNIKKYEDIELYINGDLIDRGSDSVRMLIDVKRRIENGENIVYLGGNHELMMHQVYKDRRAGRYVHLERWHGDGGRVTDRKLNELFTRDEQIEIDDFISELDVYKIFDEKIDYKHVILVHAACPYTIKDNCDLKIKDDNYIIDDVVWTRKGYFLSGKNTIGNPSYFTIIGHTPILTKEGFKYFKSENYLNVDGGCSYYVCGDFNVNHVPLVEVKDGYLKILTFNNNNEIIYGNYFYDYLNTPMSEDELEIEKSFLNKNLDMKKLVKRNGKIIYEK